MAQHPTYEDLQRRVRELEQLLHGHGLASVPGRGASPVENGRADTDAIVFEDLFDLADIQRLQDEFAAATGVASIITRPDGEPITRPSRFCRLCQDIIRSTEEGLARCCRSDAIIGAYREDGPTVQRCWSGGLMDAGAGISVDGHHLASWLIGQVRDEHADDTQARRLAHEIGADEDEVARAFQETTQMPRDQFEQVSQVLFTLANLLSRTAYESLQRARTIEKIERAEQARRHSEALHRTLIEAIPDLVWLKDPDGVYLSCNRAFERFFGAREAEILGKTDHDFVDADLAEFFRNHDLKALEVGGPRVNEEWLTFADGGYHGLFETIKSPMRDAEGRLIGVLGIARDITSRQQTEQDLRESEERYRALHNASFGGIGIHDFGRILLCNQGLAEISGYTNDELVGMDGLLLIAESARDLVRRNIASGMEEPYEAVGRRKNGEEYPLRLEARNVPYQGKMARSVEFRDITEIKQAEETQRRLQDQLHQSQKMESVGQLAGGVAHDFNNLLQVILGYGQLALEKTEAGDEVHGCVEQVMQAGQRAQTLVAQLLAFSRRQVLEMRVVDLNEAVRDSLKILERVIGEHVTLEFVAGDDLAPVLADAGRLGQLLTNLCVNARDAMPEGGTITITTGMVERPMTESTDQPERRSGAHVRLSVRDTGCGMDDTVLEQAFEPFFTTKAVGAGTGLGLSTVYGLVKQHQGFVTVESTVGQGTVFNIDLPAATRAVARPAGSAPAEVRGGSETILLAEDDAMVRQLTTRLLEKAGYTVHAAEDGRSALDLFEASPSRFDLALLDVVMPGLGGRAVFDRMREIRPEMPAIFASGYSMNAIHTGFVLDEGLVLIQKPAERDELLRRVREVLDDAAGPSAGR